MNEVPTYQPPEGVRGPVEIARTAAGYVLVQLDGESGRWLNPTALTRVVES